ncbi:dihydrolipoamide dehydrogenase [Balneicella halophila]|uniref:Dihydrolipoamide dehydrogenase n=1 Tax=Balneicella halophila TaxID=1537566 RepID=A0A7L4UPK2_BALHA|nr:dihydrolipoyl dehydrogenase [Balneicella halophila]PVX51061.1 dihydrolipoamide dehydrogenase [Balneicella halophila]
MKPTRTVDVAIIGAGTAGQSAFEQINKITDNIVVINKGYWTTTCATVGCMPSKLVIAGAERAFHALQSEEFGIGTSQKSNIEGTQVMARIQNGRDHFTKSVKKAIEDWDENKKIEGKASIIKERFIQVNEEIIEYKYLIIATGTQAVIPEQFSDKLGSMLLTSDTIFEMKDLPNKMAIVGAGPVGIELAQAFNRLGVEVILLNRTSKIAGITDKTINQKAIDCIGTELTMHLNSKITNVDRENGQAVLYFTDDKNQERTWQGDKVLIATGRHHVLDELGIENLAVELDDDKKPIHVNKQTGQIADSTIFIAGDTSTHTPILHLASYVGKNAGKVIASLLQDKDQPTFEPLTPLSIVFSEPQIAQVGAHIDNIRYELGKDNFVIGKFNFEKQGRSRIEGVNCGLIHIYANKKSGEILGASMVAPDAEYISHILAMAITHKLTVTELLKTPFYHPTILEGLRVALLDILNQLK